MIPQWGSAANQADARRKVAACERLSEAAHEFTRRAPSVRASTAGTPPAGSPVLSLAVFEEFARAAKTYEACVYLALGGFGQAAQVIAGLVAESSLIVVWAVELGEPADYQVELHALYGLQLEVEARRAVGLATAPPNESYLSDTQRAEAEALFGSTAVGLWSGHVSILELLDDIVSAQEDAFVRQQLTRLKVEITSTMAMRQSTGVAQWSHRVVQEQEDGEWGFFSNPGPGPEGVSRALHLASTTFLMAVDTVVREYAPGVADQVRAAEGFLWRAWKESSLLEGLADDDPCPCDRPDTVWGTCHKWTSALGTVTYTPFIDADLVHFTPYEPKAPKWNRELDSPPPPPSDYPSGPHVVTFTSPPC